MIENKHIGKVIVLLMVLCVIGSLLAIRYVPDAVAVSGSGAVTVEYEEKLFDTSQIITLNIMMEPEQWEELLANAIQEQYYACDVEVNGVLFRNVGIRAKGNTSLSSIAMDSTTDRYSFKLKFDEYVEGQTCFGLDKLVLNNNYADATNRKEAVVYDMFQFLGVDASLYNYAKISVNEEYWGTYLALEAIEDSFLLRNYGTQDGNLYKPETMAMGDGPGGDPPSLPDGEDREDFPSPPDGEDREDFPSPPGGEGGEDFPSPPDGEGREDFPSPPDGGSGEERPSLLDGENREDFPFPRGNGERMEQPQDVPGEFPGNRNGGADLNYSDDNLESYETIWDGEKQKSSDKDKQRVVTAIEKINKGEDLEEYLDVDNILKYMAVHEFVVNEDSLSGNMAHNYYLYESNGTLNLLPWDYNLSFGGMTSGGGKNDATAMINDAIDTPFDGTQFFDALLENEEYREKYHEYLRMLCEEYVQGGRLKELWERLDEQTDTLIAEDPTSFYTEEEYTSAKELLYKVIELRAQSVLAQIDGTIPSTESEQKEAQQTLIDATGMDLSVMGEFHGGGH